MKHISTILFVLIFATSFGQYCPALGPDQFLPCGQGTTNLTADLSQCGPGGPAPKQTTDYLVTSIPYVAQVNTGTNIFMVDDSQQGPFNIGFNFCFFGTTYTQFYIGSNGWISFSGGQPTTFTSSPIPTANPLVPKNCIMGPWQDWHPGVGGQIKYQTIGVAPCRKLIVSWIGVPMFSCTGNQGTFHIVINESTNYIDNYIQNKPDCQAWQGGTSVEGIHNAAGTIGIPVPGRNSTAWVANNDAWRWVPNGPTVNPVLTWYRIGNPNPIGTGLSINVTPPAAGASYTCRYVYPICNAGWNTCNAVAGLGPDTVFVQPGPPFPVVSPINSSDTICFQSNNEVYSVIEQPGVWYQWDAVGGIISGQGTDSITVDWSSLTPGFIPGAVMVTPEANGCVGMAVSFDLFILNVVPTIDPVGPFCEYDEFVTLQAFPLGGIMSGPGVVGYDFTPSNAVGVDTIIYQYTLSGCTFDDTTLITVHPKPTLDSIAPHNTFFELCELGTTTITWTAIGSPAGYNVWTWNNQTFQQDALTQTLGWDSSGIHIVSAVHWANGCVSDPRSTTINIIQCPETIFYMPNTFTPDGDEWNQVWQPVITSGIDPADFELYIYNRWGEIIWESRSIFDGWDGTYNNKQCTEGVYFYVARCTDTKTAKKFLAQGHITLLK
jgi:gliding motility-associated-like protein